MAGQQTDLQARRQAAQPEPRGQRSDEGSPTLRAILALAWRCWPYYRPQLKHLVTFVLLNSLTGVLILAALFIGNDLIENKIMLGERLQPMQATLLLVGEDYVTTGQADEPPLTDEQRRRVRLGVILLGGLLTILLLVVVALVIYYMVWIFQQINQRLRVEMLSKAERLSLRYHSATRTGDAIYRVYQDSATITNVLQFLVITPIRIVAWVGFCIALLMFFSPWLGLIALGAALPIALLMKALMPRVREAARISREAHSDLTSRIQETLAAIRVIKASGAEARMMARFDKESQAALDAAFRMRLYILLLAIGVAVIGMTAFLIAEYFMATWAMAEKATYLGATVVLVGFASWNLGAFKSASGRGDDSARQTAEFAFTWAIVQDILVGLKRAFYLLDQEPAVAEPASPKPFPKALRQVSFDKVRFGYDAGKQVLQGVTLTAETGTITALVGATGSGKSTLMSLLLRLYDPDAGQVAVNGIDLRRLGLSDLRAKVAIALQQNPLFAMSVANNIRYGRDHAPDEAVQAAAQVACADEFIRAMPDGYATELGERGGKLSTGQRQRLSIARAILRDTPILALDEPTASLDAETERRVLGNLAEWGRGRVVFIITHRLSTIRDADQIAFLEEGVIKELGRHEALMNQGGAYSRFVQAELGGPAHD